MLTLSVMLAWVQQQGGGFSWSGDDIRTAMIGAMTTMGGVGLRVLWTLRDDVRDVKRALPKIEEAIALHEKEIRWLTGKRIAQEAIEEAERQNYHGTDRRHRHRRDRDIVNDALAHSDEYPAEGGE